MAALAAKDHLSEVVGLKNDIVNAVFSCPQCKTDVTISRWQVQGELPILCARCNSRYSVRGEELVDHNRPLEYFPEHWQDGKPQPQATGYKVMVGLDAVQKATPLPKDSWTLVMKPELAPKPAPAPAPPAAAPAPAAEAPKTEP
ncbi:MAG TPA: hypothetical protein VK914_06960 [bacterium]|jgi:hypothetical protein|nr:hypothetical protein [bacterium]